MFLIFQGLSDKTIKMFCVISTLKPLKLSPLCYTVTPPVVYAVQLVGMKTLYLQKLVKIGF